MPSSSATPLTDVDVYCDDFLLTSRGKPAEIERDLVAAADDLKPIIERDFGCKLALDKATVTAASFKSANRIRKRLGAAGGPPTLVAQFLGIDQLHGRPRQALARHGKMKVRMARATARACRLSRLRTTATAKPGAVKIFSTGVFPAATHGADVLGVSDAQAKQLTRQYHG